MKSCTKICYIFLKKHIELNRPKSKKAELKNSILLLKRVEEIFLIASRETTFVTFFERFQSQSFPKLSYGFIFH